LNFNEKQTKKENCFPHGSRIMDLDVLRSSLKCCQHCKADATVSINSLGVHKNLVFGTWIEILLIVHRKEVEAGGTTTVVLRTTWLLNIYNLHLYPEMNSAYKLAAPQPQIRYLKESVSFRGAMLWNSHLQDL
ncbi:unnamed protein product, partial [Pocillopora meandrina]